jgi:hypothetical protein
MSLINWSNESDKGMVYDTGHHTQIMEWHESHDTFNKVTDNIIRLPDKGTKELTELGVSLFRLVEDVNRQY